MKRTREFLVIGDLTDAEEAQIGALLKRHGLRIFNVKGAIRPGALLQVRGKVSGLVVPRVRGEAWLKATKLPDALPKGSDKEAAYEILDRVRVKSAYGLTQTLFDDFMLYGSTDTWQFEVRTGIIQYMIDQGIVFADLNPALVFRTPLTDRKDLSRLLHKISHLRWLEMFAFITEQEARLFGLGPIWMGKVRSAMNDIEIGFVPGH